MDQVAAPDAHDPAPPAPTPALAAVDLPLPQSAPTLNTPSTAIPRRAGYAPLSLSLLRFATASGTLTAAPTFMGALRRSGFALSVRSLGARVLSLSRWIPAQAVATTAARSTARLVVSGSPTWRAFARVTQSAHMVYAKSTPRLLTVLAALLLALFQAPLLELSEDEDGDDVSFTSHSSWDDDDDDDYDVDGDDVDAPTAGESVDAAEQTVDSTSESLLLSDQLPEHSDRGGAGFAVRGGSDLGGRAGSGA